MPFDILNEKSLEWLIESLQAAHNAGFSTSISSAEVLLQVMIDCSLKLSQELKEGLNLWKSRTNPEIKFLDKPVPGSKMRQVIPDAFHNPKTVKIKGLEERAFSPQLAEYFHQLCLHLIQISKTHRVPEDLYSNGHQQRANRSGQTPAQYWYLRRKNRGTHPHKKKKH